MAELERLLSFMSSWDRQATLEKYETLLDSSDAPETLMEELGTPTRVAIDLARTYVPSPAPVREETPAPAEEGGSASETPAEPAPAEEAPEQIQWDLSPEEETGEPATKQVIRRGALCGYLVPAILIGLPIAVALVCLGLPFIAAGTTLGVTAVLQGLTIIGSLTLFSDILLTVGGVLVVCAVGLLLVWLGLWLAMTLCWLWVDKVLVALGRKLCIKEVPAE